MQYDPFHRNYQGIRYVESATPDQDASVIEQLRLGWLQTITIEFVPGSPIVNESNCVEGSISEVHDARP